MRKVVLTLAGVLSLAFSVFWAGPAMAADGGATKTSTTVVAAPHVIRPMLACGFSQSCGGNLRNGPSTNNGIEFYVPDGRGVFIDCHFDNTGPGGTVNGYWGVTNRWYHISWVEGVGNVDGWMSDGVVYTGTAQWRTC
jgi:hypothetical protein